MLTPKAIKKTELLPIGHPIEFLRHKFLMNSKAKVQLISKCLVGILNHLKKRNTMIPPVDLFPFIFWEY